MYDTIRTLREDGSIVTEVITDYAGLTYSGRTSPYTNPITWEYLMRVYDPDFELDD